MRRYVTTWVGKPVWQDDTLIAGAKTIFEPDNAPRKTGLLDSSGTPLYAVDSIDEIGFVRHK